MKKWIESKKFMLGPFVRIPRPEMIEIMALSGFDFVVVDLEHGGTISHNDLYPMILAAENKGIKIFARVPGIQENYFKWLLDMGISGLQIPHIKTEEDAKKAVKFSKFYPIGERGLCRFVRAAEFSNIKKDDYISKTNEKNMLILQIEGKEGVDNIEKIAAVEGIDIIFVGPYDLSQSMGLIGQIWHENVVNEILKVVKVCNEKNISVGVFTDTPEGVKFWSEKGIKYINYRIDVELLLSNVKNHIIEINKLRD